MPDLLASPWAAPTLAAATALAGLTVLALRYRLSFEWSPASGNAHNRIYALMVALIDRRRPERKFAFYVYLAAMG